MILGHLIPAGTGFQSHQQAECRIRPEALEELQAEKERILAARMNLLTEQTPDVPGMRPTDTSS